MYVASSLLTKLPTRQQHHDFEFIPSKDVTKKEYLILVLKACPLIH